MSTELTLSNAANMICYQAGGQAFTRLTTPATTKADLQILQAMTGRQLKEVNDMELDALLLKLVNTVLLLLGHKNQWQDQNDQALFITALNECLRRRWAFLTLEELQIVFTLGANGELKQKPEDRLFLNLEQVNSWLRVYKFETKAKAIKTTKIMEEAKEIDYTPLAFLKEGLQKIADESITPLDYRLLTAAYYDRFKQAGLLPAKPKEEWEQMLREERRRVLDRGNKNLDMLQDKTRKAFSTFKQALKEGQGITGNSYEDEVKTACRVRVFTETLQRLAWEETDLTTLTF
jgi:hypothetical protein